MINIEQDIVTVDKSLYDQYRPRHCKQLISRYMINIEQGIVDS